MRVPQDNNRETLCETSSYRMTIRLCCAIRSVLCCDTRSYDTRSARAQKSQRMRWLYTLKPPVISYRQKKALGNT